MRNKYLLFTAALGWFIISFILLTIPGVAFPTEDWFDKIWLDKWIHIGLFAVLVVLWCLYWRSVKMNLPEKLRKAFITIGILVFVYGTIMEFVQLYCIAYRSFDFGDVVADAAGAAIGVIYSTRRYIKK